MIQPVFCRRKIIFNPIQASLVSQKCEWPKTASASKTSGFFCENPTSRRSLVPRKTPQILAGFFLRNSKNSEKRDDSKKNATTGRDILLSIGTPVTIGFQGKNWPRHHTLGEATCHDSATFWKGFLFVKGWKFVGKKNMFVWVQKKHWFTVDSMKVNF